MNELKKIISDSFPKYIIDSAYDYGDIVVFNLIAQDHSNLTDSPLNRSFSVSKETKEIKPFFPFDIPYEQFKNGKKII